MNDLIDLTSVQAVGQNYLYLIAKLANLFMAKLTAAMDSVMPISTLLILCFTMMGAVFTFKMVAAFLRGLQEGHPKGLLGALLDEAWSSLPRIALFVTFTLAACGVTVLMTTGSRPLNTSNAWYNPDITKIFADPKVLGREDTAYPTPVEPLRAGTTMAIKTMSVMEMASIKSRIDAEIKAMVDRGQAKQANQATASGAAQAGTPSYDLTDLTLAYLLQKIVGSALDFGISLSNMIAQYTIAKNLIGNLIYACLAWRMALHFLPLMICLAYFRSLQGFLLNIAKHLIAIAIACALVGGLAKVVFGPAFWFGGTNDVVSQAIGTKGGILGQALSTSYIQATTTPWSPGTYPWLKQTFDGSLLLIRLGTMWTLLGVMLGEMFGIVRGAMDGALRASYSQSIASSIGK